MAPSDPDDPDSPLVAQSLEEMLAFVPGLSYDRRFRFRYESIEKPLDSSNVGPDNWIEMAKIIERSYDDYDGFIILHGTDTMAYTSSALAFMFENLSKPVVLTGSQIPISGIRTDGVMNFVNSVYVAGYKVSGLPCIPEVVIVFGDRIIRGCRARKVSAASWAGFDSPNFPHLGHIGERIRVAATLLRPMPDAGRQFSVNTSLDTRVLDIGLTPGFRPAQLRHILSIPDIHAVLLRTFGTGNAPDGSEFLDTISSLTREGKTVLNVTQCLEGTVEMGLYAASSGLLERGVISALDMTPEAALTKLMWTLGTKVGDQVGIQMQVNQRGEQSENLFDLRFGEAGGPSRPVRRFVHYVIPDRRLNVSKLNKAVVRVSALEVDCEVGSEFGIRIFMNMPSASGDDPSQHPRCIAALNLVWDGQPITVARVIDEVQAKSLIGDGDITLTVVATGQTHFRFRGLFLAVFSNA